LFGSKDALAFGTCLGDSHTLPLRLILPICRIIHLAGFAQGLVGTGLGIFEQLHAGAEVVFEEAVEGAEGRFGGGAFDFAGVDGQLWTG
jgi:hypothetical protein